MLRPAEEVEPPVRILFLAAKPTDTDPLRLGEEVRTIDERLREADYRDQLDLVPHFAVRLEDLSKSLLRYKPHLVHFSGHGSPSGAIILEDASGRSNEVSPKVLGDLFGILRDNLRCVVLNACYSATQANEVTDGIDCVVGTTRTGRPSPSWVGAVRPSWKVTQPARSRSSSIPVNRMNSRTGPIPAKRNSQTGFSCFTPVTEAHLLSTSPAASQ